MTGINNEDAQAFCMWLSAREGGSRTYRVPRYYEHEYAMRAGTQTRYWWGDLPDYSKMNVGMSAWARPTPVRAHTRDCDPQELFLGAKKFLHS